MTNRKQQAEQRALQLLSELGIDCAPVDVIDIAEKSGAAVIEKPLEDTVSGFLLVKNKQAVIVFNANHHSNRQRFTIAHELGHYLLHKEKAFFLDSQMTFYRDQHSSEGIYWHEIEANTFAAALLMPNDLLESYLRNQQFDLYNPLDVTSLSSKFGVSEQALTIRLVSLGLVNS